MFVLFKKLHKVKKAIKDWNKNDFGRVEVRIHKGNINLGEIQTFLEQDLLNRNFQEKERLARMALTHEEANEESFLSPKILSILA